MHDRGWVNTFASEGYREPFLGGLPYTAHRMVAGPS